MWVRGIFLAIAAALVGCASSEYPRYTSESTFLMPHSDDESLAEGDAWAGSSMYPRKLMPQHERKPANDYDFYFKHCAMNGNEVFYSKTSYDCAGPYN